MERYHLDKPDETVKQIVAAAFPAYRGRRFALAVQDKINVKSYWDGGSRDYFVFVRLDDLAILTMPPQSDFDKQIAGAEDAPIPEGFVCVEHSIFCGKDHGITIHASTATLSPLLPDQSGVLSWAEQIVLYATRSLKSSYAGIPDLRRHEAKRETDITDDDYTAAKTSLVVAKYLNAVGAITPKGRNACQGFSWPIKNADE